MSTQPYDITMGVDIRVHTSNPADPGADRSRADPMTYAHIPVLAERVVDLLAPALQTPGATLVDCTLGMGGHTEMVLTRCPQAHVIGIDRDLDALRRAESRLAPFGSRFESVHTPYDELERVLRERGLSHVAAVLFDLGVSSFQLDEAERGFAYAHDAPLDMRMDQTEGLSAADILNSYDEADLARILRRYGEEKFASRLARAIVTRRADRPWVRSGELVELIYATIPAAARRTGGHPAKRTFQALRIEVNDELGGVRRAVPAALANVGVGGRVVVEAYHSLEDRIVKHAFAEVTTSTAPRDLPVVPTNLLPRFVSLTRGADKATDAEVTANPRAASVRLRAVERVAA